MDDLTEFDEAYYDMFESIKKFFRYHKTNLVDSEICNDDFYKRAAELAHGRIDHEIKYLHNPDLT